MFEVVADLVSEHDEMRKHAVTLVQKCRQAESVNAALEQECSRMQTMRPDLAPKVKSTLTHTPLSSTAAVKAVCIEHHPNLHNSLGASFLLSEIETCPWAFNWGYQMCEFCFIASKWPERMTCVWGRAMG